VNFGIPVDVELRLYQKVKTPGFDIWGKRIASFTALKVK
jgi:hypothetical protein